MRRSPALAVLLLCCGCRPAPSTAKSVSLQAVDAELGQLTAGAATLESPDTLRGAEPATVRLTVSTGRGALGALPAESLALASRMRATLAAPDLQVTPITPELQAVSAGLPTSWSWDIRGATAGVAPLHVSVSAVLVLDGVETPRVLRTYDRRVVVVVPLADRIGDFLQEQWQWLLATILTPAGALAWRWSRRRRSPARA